jgi:hypothetical protein
MNTKNVEAIQAATVKALAAQVERTLAVARIKGWEFPASADIGLTVVASTAVATKVKARMDTTTVEANISSTNTVEDISKLAGALVDEWLLAHATTKPAKRRAGT